LAVVAAVGAEVVGAAGAAVDAGAGAFVACAGAGASEPHDARRAARLPKPVPSRDRRPEEPRTTVSLLASPNMMFVSLGTVTSKLKNGHPAE